MDLAFQLVGIGVAGSLMVAVMRQLKPELAPLVMLAISAIAMTLMVNLIGDVVDFLYEMADAAGVNSVMMTTVLKVIGIAYIVEIASSICRDVGETAIATKVELGGKLLIISFSLPIIKTLITSIMKMAGAV